MADIDDLMSELYTTDGQPNKAKPKPQAKASASNWDDDDDDDDGGKKNNKPAPTKPTPSATTAPAPAPKPAMAPSSSASSSPPQPVASAGATAPPAKPKAAASGFDDSDDDAVGGGVGPGGSAVATATTASGRPAVPWPTLPLKYLVPRCPPRSARLVSCLPFKVMLAQQKILFEQGKQQQGPAVSGSGNGNATGSSSPITPGATGAALPAWLPDELGDDDNGDTCCPYLLCGKCDHVVVRLQHAYFSRRQKVTAAHKAKLVAEKDTKKADDEQEGGGKEAPAKACKKSYDDWDDDSPDHHHGHGSGAPPIPTASPASGGGGASPAAASLTEEVELDDAAMYIQCRYHYPDFGAFPPGILRRTSRAPAAAGGQGVTDESAPTSAAYCCQCAYVSVALPSGITLQSARGAKTVATPPTDGATALQGKFPGFASCDLSDVKWECRGHLNF